MLLVCAVVVLEDLDSRRRFLFLTTVKPSPFSSSSILSAQFLTTFSALLREGSAAISIRREKTGSLEAKPRIGGPSTCKSVVVTVSQNVEDIETVSTYGEVSARQVSRQTGISYEAVTRAPRIFRRFHELKVGDFEKRQEFAAWVFRQIDIDENRLSSDLWADEAHFSLNREVNTQISRVSATENPWISTEMPLHQPIVIVWCGFTSSFIIGPFFFEENNGRTFKTIYITGVQLLREKDRQALGEITFKQYGGPPHISCGAKQLLKDTFSKDRVICRHFIHQWPPRSPDLTPCDFWLWGTLSRVFIDVGLPHCPC
ncbi:hypothetical protein LAZ67_5002621 [Cordylochernes scorpioides]|uniref:Transposase n=1 Tax=Cordylochernes scorpioides TaxID=51811 RepID=A0ABY6KHP7_9ARAC|nr:hypothetical protein LAZ67_5002621 [Cordylochernes scorpioides]